MMSRNYSKKKIKILMAICRSKNSQVKKPKSKLLSKPWTKMVMGIYPKTNFGMFVKDWLQILLKPLSKNLIKKEMESSITGNFAKWWIDGKKKKRWQLQLPQIHQENNDFISFLIFPMKSTYSTLHICPHQLCKKFAKETIFNIWINEKYFLVLHIYQLFGNNLGKIQ